MLLISREMAQSIVEEIEPVIDESINIMDSDGIIVASSNASRLGQYHGGAHRVVRERLPELTIEYDGEYTGSLKGVNFPIMVNDEIIGVVGITGDRSQVQKLGHIIRKMTEILIAAYERSSSRMRHEQVRDRFLADLVFLENLDPHAVRAQSRAFGIDLRAPATVAVIDTMARLTADGPNRSGTHGPDRSGTPVPDRDEPPEPSTGTSGPLQEASRQKPAHERLLDEIRSELAAEGGVHVILHGSTYILIVQSDVHPDPDELLRAIKARLEARTGLHLLCGIGSRAASGLDLRPSYLNAVKAASISGTYFNGEVSDYEDLRIELVVEELPRPLRQDILDRVFRGDSEADRAEWARLISAYFDLNGSINRMAESLFIHKNTVQYRLTKLKDSTGYDVRKARDAVMLYLAMLFYKSLKS